MTPNYLPELPQAIEGTAGADGRDGKDGRDGVDGKNAELILAGEYKRNRVYGANSVVTHEGSSYIAKVETKSEPPGKAWQLLAAAGADGADGEAVVYAQRGRPGRDGKDAVLDTPAVADVPMNVGDVIYASGPGRVDKAQANDGETTTAIGIVTSVNSSAISYRTTGVVTNPAWALVPKAVYYLDPFTPGGMTTIYPETAGHFVVILGVATSATQLALNIHYMLEQS
ncbi:hypothetical protein [Lacipirellula sp.]|uniref:hypothetical protein n=1 Tax=Lacipirellula sp. TaxID=2691419 RepID=UPI003D126253